MTEGTNPAYGSAQAATERRRGSQWLRRIAGRAYYAVSAKLDAKPEELLTAALRDAERRGRAPLCLAASFRLDPGELAVLAREPPVNAIVAKQGVGEIRLLQEQVPDAKLGAYWEPGHWMLPAGIVHVYLVGSWRLLTLPMLQEAVRQHVVTLTVRLGRAWVDVPLDAIRLAAGYRRRLMPLWQALSFARTVLSFGGTQAADTVPVPPGNATPGAVTAHRAVKKAPAFGTAMLCDVIKAARPEWKRDYVPGRVALACGSLQPGGAERQLAYTAAGLTSLPEIESVAVLCDLLTPQHPELYDFYLPLIKRSGVQSKVVTRYAGTPGMIEEPAALAAATPSFPEGLLLDIANLYKEFQSLRPEVVHAWLDWSNTRAGFAAALAGVPRIVLSGRNLNPTNFGLYQSYMDPIYQALCTLPNVVMLNNSQAGAASYAEWLGISPDRISVIHNAFDTAAELGDRASMRAQLGIPPNAPVVGGVMRFYPEKRPLLWLEVAARVFREQPETWFVMVGQGILQVDIENTARRLGIADRLLLPGVVGNVLPMMQAFDVFLLTSYGEGLPNVVLEAQWAGTPVVVTDAGGAAEALNPGVTGWVVDAPDPDELAGRVVALLQDAALRSRARAAGPAWIRERFGMRRMIQETIRAYDLDLRDDRGRESQEVFGDRGVG